MGRKFEDRGWTIIKEKQQTNMKVKDCQQKQLGEKSREDSAGADKSPGKKGSGKGGMDIERN